MNDKFLHITNSLNDQYPPADIPEDLAWAEMRKLLDDEDDIVLPPPPPPPPPMPPNGNGYWKYGLLVLLILTMGIVVYVNSNKTEPIQAAKHEENNTKQKANAQYKDSAQSFGTNDSEEKYHSTQPVESPVTNGQQNKTTTDQVIEKNPKSTDKKNIPLPTESFPAKNNQRTTGSNTKVKTSGGDVDENNAGIAPTYIIDNNRGTKKSKKSTGKGAVANSPGTKSKYPQIVNNNNQNISESNVNIDDEKNVKPLNFTDTATNTPVAVYDSSTDNNADTLKKQLSNKSKPENNKADSTPASNKKNKKIALAAGLGLNQFFTIAEQKHSPYNSSGKVGAISDYIPVPFVRMYFNKKLYVQVEAQFNAPQYTQQLLANTGFVIDTTGPVPVDNQVDTYINKLFYFNIPLSIHYSPFKNFYVGAGLQFSQLNNAVGLFETRRFGTDSLLKTNYASIKNDSVYKEIKTNEWRVLVDANYQWKNLVLGLRYNQALSNFINVQISGTEITQARNSSLQLYLRYILWKNKPAKVLFKK